MLCPKLEAVFTLNFSRTRWIAKHVYLLVPHYITQVAMRSHYVKKEISLCSVKGAINGSEKVWTREQIRNFNTLHFCLCHVGATHAFKSDLDKGSCGGLVSLRAEAGWRMVHREEPPLAGEYNLSLSATTREQWEKHHKQQLVAVKLKKCKCMVS